MERKIPFFNYPAQYKENEEEYDRVIKDVLSRGAYILQRDLEAFEAELRSYLGVRHAYGVADGTNAIMIGLRAVGIGPGDEVILPSHTYIASAAAVHFAGATPVLVEIGPDHMIDPASVAAAITPRTKAIMPVQLNGRTCDMAALQALADARNLMIVEDAAQALGSKFKGRGAGTFGAFGTFSFYPAKVLGCFGDGGAVVTNDDEVGERLALLRDHGRNAEGRVVAWGTNSRLDNLQAAILLAKFKRFDREVERRREIAGLYDESLRGINDLTLPPGPEADPDRFDVYQNYELEAGQRDGLRTHLAERGIGTIVQWAGTPVHRFEELGLYRDLPITDRFFERCFMLPMNTTLSNDDVAYVCDAIHDFYA